MNLLRVFHVRYGHTLAAVLLAAERACYRRGLLRPLAAFLGLYLAWWALLLSAPALYLLAVASSLGAWILLGLERRADILCEAWDPLDSPRQDGRVRYRLAEDMGRFLPDELSRMAEDLHDAGGRCPACGCSLRARSIEGIRAHLLDHAVRKLRHFIRLYSDCDCDAAPAPNRMTSGKPHWAFCRRRLADKALGLDAPVPARGP